MSNKPNQEQKAPTEKGDVAREESEPQPPSPPTIPKTQPKCKNPEKENTYQKKGYRLQRCYLKVQIGLLIATTLAFIAASIYAWVAYRQWCTMDATFKEVEKQTAATIKSSNAATDAVKVAKDTLDMQKDSVEKTLAEMKAQSKAMQLAAKTAQQSADIAERNLQVARDTFNAANRPYVGVNAVGVIHAGTHEVGEPVSSKIQTKETTNLNFEVETKNFGLVPGINYFHSWRMFVDGVPQPGHGIPDRPKTIFPGQSLWLKGGVGSRDYPVIMSGEKMLVIEVTVEYDGPSGHYKECNKLQYAPNVNAFMNLGPMCTK